jgi:hypothetical protein
METNNDAKNGKEKKLVSSFLHIHADPTAASALDTAGARHALLRSSYACAEGCVASGMAPALIRPPSNNKCPQSTKVTPPLAAPPFFFAYSFSAALVASIVGLYLLGCACWSPFSSPRGKTPSRTTCAAGVCSSSVSTSPDLFRV